MDNIRDKELIEHVEELDREYQEVIEQVNALAEEEVVDNEGY